MLMCLMTADDVSSPAVQQKLPDVAASWGYVNPCSLEITLTVTWVEAQDSTSEKQCCFFSMNSFCMFFLIGSRQINFGSMWQDFENAC